MCEFQVDGRKSLAHSSREEDGLGWMRGGEAEEVAAWMGIGRSDGGETGGGYEDDETGRGLVIGGLVIGGLVIGGMAKRGRDGEREGEGTEED